MSSEDEKSPMQLGFEFAPVSAAARAPGLAVARKAAVLAAVVSAARMGCRMCVPSVSFGRKTTSGPVLPRRGRRLARIRKGVGSGGKDGDAGSRRELLDVLEADLAETGAKR